jgi:hypothetical protein
MRTDDDLERFFAALNDADRNMLTVEEFRNEVKKRQPFDDE